MQNREDGFLLKRMLKVVLVHSALACGITLVLLALAALAVSGGVFALESKLALVLGAELLGVLTGSYRAAKSVQSRKLPTGVLTGFAVFLFLLMAGSFFHFPPAGHSIFILLIALLASLAGAMLSERPKRRRRRD